ncbi:LysE family translocator [Paracoccus yeei]|uniref:LysE family translocator n=1 Tax=Paracoccus yeei TaxID=147645 RepID=UPI001C8DF9DE|nr:LysE family translocator [Paracoccus yeei]MBY0138262.1 LysE family translocator [Paracoccus yeei]
MVLDMVAQFPAQQLLAFMAGALVLNLTPGQDVFFASACGIQNGPRAGALAGLGALVAAHPGALVAIKYMGAAYLLVLAWKSWHAAAAPEGRAQAARNPWAIVRRGALSNLLNPKPVLFLLAFLPQFTRPEYGPVGQQILALGLMFACSGTLVTMGYGMVAGLAGKAMAARMRVVNRIASVMFAGLALRLVWK